MPLKQKIMILNYGPKRRTFSIYPEVLADIMLFNKTPEQVAELKLKTPSDLWDYLPKWILENFNGGLQARKTVIHRFCEDLHEEIREYEFKKK